MKYVLHGIEFSCLIIRFNSSIFSWTFFFYKVILMLSTTTFLCLFSHISSIIYKRTQLVLKCMKNKIIHDQIA